MYFVFWKQLRPQSRRKYAFHGAQVLHQVTLRIAVRQANPKINAISGEVLIHHHLTRILLNKWKLFDTNFGYFSFIFTILYKYLLCEFMLVYYMWQEVFVFGFSFFIEFSTLPINGSNYRIADDSIVMF